MGQSGYSVTPLAKKLGIKSGSVIRLINEPANYSSLFSDFPDDVSIENSGIKKKHLIHLFITSQAGLVEKLLPLK